MLACDDRVFGGVEDAIKWAYGTQSRDSYPATVLGCVRRSGEIVEPKFPGLTQLEKMAQASYILRFIWRNINAADRALLDARYIIPDPPPRLSPYAVPQSIRERIEINEGKLSIERKRLSKTFGVGPLNCSQISLKEVYREHSRLSYVLDQLYELRSKFLAKPVMMMTPCVNTITKARACHSYAEMKYGAGCKFETEVIREWSGLGRSIAFDTWARELDCSMRSVYRRRSKVINDTVKSLSELTGRITGFASAENRLLGWWT